METNVDLSKQKQPSPQVKRCYVCCRALRARRVYSSIGKSGHARGGGETICIDWIKYRT